MLHRDITDKEATEILLNCLNYEVIPKCPACMLELINKEINHDTAKQILVKFESIIESNTEPIFENIRLLYNICKPNQYLLIWAIVNVINIWWKEDQDFQNLMEKIQ